MNDFKNWYEVTKGLFRYVIAANAAYEIHLCKWYDGTDILTAKANLYIVGDWNVENGVRGFFERELITKEQTVSQCIKDAVKDHKENNS